EARSPPGEPLGGAAAVADGPLGGPPSAPEVASGGAPPNTFDSAAGSVGVLALGRSESSIESSSAGASPAPDGESPAPDGESPAPDGESAAAAAVGTPSSLEP